MLSLILLFLLPLLSFSQPSTFSFTNVFFQSGLTAAAPPVSNKFGGPCIADVDGDGIPDLILNHHNRNWTRMYLGRGDLTYRIFFDSQRNRLFRPVTLDTHGFSVARTSARSPGRLITVGAGGGGGGNLRPPEVYEMSPQRQLLDITRLRGFGQIASRGRNAVFMEMGLRSQQQKILNGGGPDVLFTNFLLPRVPGMGQFAYQNVGGTYLPVRNVGQFTAEPRGSVEVTDIDGDGVMEVISIEGFRFFKLVAPFTLNDITFSVVPLSLTFERFTVNAVVEIDFDNDGDFDLYCARARREVISQRGVSRGNNFDDFLLRNDNGKYVDVTASAGLPKGTDSIGVTAGDFNNDGWVDLLVVLYSQPDIVLLNNGDGTFTQRTGLIPKGPSAVGNNAQAADLNLDGRVEAVVGHGDLNGEARIGPYLLLRNNLVLGSQTNYLLVTVLNDNLRASTALHATVFVRVGGMTMTRRVGSRGGGESSGSLIDTVHFGLGSAGQIDSVTVRWTGGVTETRTNVAANQRITVGLP